ncbi:MAG TPA: serine protease [Candidatus Paceibacterota bacterium]
MLYAFLILKTFLISVLFSFVPLQDLPPNTLSEITNTEPFRSYEEVTPLEIKRQPPIAVKTTEIQLPNASAKKDDSPAATPTSTGIPMQELNLKTKAALVNIFCVGIGKIEYSISGTGIFISENGVVLTNAHLAQYLLLASEKERFFDCVLRTGSPAVPTYRARILYLPPQWVKDHPSHLSEARPTGTGENDYALLLVTRRVDGRPLPDKFPYISPDPRVQLYPGNVVLEAAYPAGFLGNEFITKNLNSGSSIAHVVDVLSFDGQSRDFAILEGTVVAQQGSSGGAIVGPDGTQVGLIVTLSDGKTTSERKLGIITTFHIARTIEKFTGQSLASFATESEVKADKFEETESPALITILKTALNLE